MDRKEKIFSSNPLKSVSGGLFSPIPKGLMAKMANLNMNQHRTSPTTSGPSSNTPTRASQQASQQTRSRGVVKYQAAGNSQNLMMEDYTLHKRKLVANLEHNNSAVVNQTSGNSLAGLNNKASHPL